MYILFVYITPRNKTRNGGCLGSCNDEERSEMRNVMRIAELVNHQIFERKLRSWVILRACLFECPLKTHFIHFNFNFLK